MAFNYFVVGSGCIGKRQFGNLKMMGKSAELLAWQCFGAQGITQKLASQTGNAAAIIATATDIHTELVGICAAHSAPMYIKNHWLLPALILTNSTALMLIYKNALWSALCCAMIL